MASEVGGRSTRPLHFAVNAFRHPRRFSRAVRIKNWSRRTVLLAIMQSLDNSIRLRVKFVLPGEFPVLTTEQAADNPNPNYIPEGYHAAN